MVLVVVYSATILSKEQIIYKHYLQPLLYTIMIFFCIFDITHFQTTALKKNKAISTNTCHTFVQNSILDTILVYTFALSSVFDEK